MAASRVACASFNIGTNTTITITRDKSSYTHTITWAFGSASGTISTKTAQTSVVWSPDPGTLYAQIPNAVSGYGEVTCKTYDGNTLIGTTKAGFYAYAVKANCAPAVSGTIEDTNPATIALTGDKAALVLYMSKPKVTLNASPKNSATIKSLQIYNPIGLTATSSPYTFDTVYDKLFRLTAVDSRGFSTVVEKSVDKFILYDPTFFRSLTMKRKESTSETAVASISGFAYNASFGVSGNSLTVKYRYRTASGTFGGYIDVPVEWGADGNFTAEIEIPGLSLSEQYIFQFVSEDKLTSFQSDDILVGAASGDFRIAKNYVQFKNTVHIGDKSNEAYKSLRLRRKVGGSAFDGHLALDVTDKWGVLALQLFQDGINKGRIELRPDGNLYNYISSMSIAEIMSSSPPVESVAGQGFMLLNGGDSVSPILIQWGRVDITPTAANTPTSFTVYFNHQYAGRPFVCCGKSSSVPAQVFEGVNEIATDKFTIVLQRPNTVTTSVLWLAIGNGTNALPE